MKKPAIIHVDMDAKCKRCGKGGAVVGSGVCLACVAKAIQGGEFDQVINKRLARVKGANNGTGM